jgi:hypothetical protein
MEPMTLAAGAIAKLAFDEAIKAGAGEAAKKGVGGAIALMQQLGGMIRDRFQGNEKATKAIAELEQQPSEAALSKVSKYLDLEMDEDAGFADEVRQMAQQIVNIQNQSTGATYHQTAGRDIFNIEDAGTGNKFGGS